MKNIAHYAFLCTAATLAFSVPALADSYTFTLTTPTVSVAAGSTYTYTGIITANAGNGADLSLIGATANGDAPLVFDTSDFFNDTPFTLRAGDSYSGNLFTVTLPSDIAGGSYLGAISLELDDAAGTPLDETANFTVNASTAVAATPEPSSWLLLCSGLGGVAALRRRFVRA